MLDFIGEGGMGLVYKVEHLIMHRILALKVLKTEQLSESAWLRFRKEAQAIARLDHPNIVKIYDMNKTDDGRPFYTMDLLEGDSLADYLQQNHHLSWSNALPIFRQVCNGLAYANDRGIIHRDIKPGNIMLSLGIDAPINTASVKIVDFGIAKLVDDDGRTIQALTAAGEVFGSPLYMSPEQCLGGRLDGRSDMYSVGVSLFQALTGRPPLLGRTAVETTILHQTTAAPALNAVAADLYFPPRLESIVAKLLAKDPSDRFQSLADVAALLVPSIDSDRSESATQENNYLGSKNAPLFVTAQDRGLENEFGQTSENNTDSQLSGSKVPLMLTAVAVIILAGVLTTFSFLGQRSPSKISDLPSAITKPAEVGIPDDYLPRLLARKYDYGSEPEVSASEIKEINAFLSSDVKQFSRLKKVGKDTIKEFHFPSKFSLGNLFFDEGRSKSRQQAADIIRVSEKAKLVLEGNYIIGAYPELLKYFRPDELYSLKIERLPQRNAKLLPMVGCLTGLTVLELPQAHVNNNDLSIIAGLPNLQKLNIAQCDVTGAALASCGVLARLLSLNIEKIDQVALVLARVNPKIEELDLSQTELSSDDLKAVARLQNLHSLVLSGTSISDSDLLLLLPLKNKLTLLNINECPNLTLASVETLKQFRRMRELTLPNVLKTSSVKLVLERALPRMNKILIHMY